MEWIIGILLAIFLIDSDDWTNDKVERSDFTNLLIKTTSKIKIGVSYARN